MTIRPRRDIAALLPGLFACVVALAAAAWVLPDVAQGPDPRHARYDPATEVTFDGTVEEVLLHDRGRGHRGVYLLVTGEDGPVEVHLGPDFHLDAEGVAFATGETVTVTGCRVTFGNGPAILARTIARGEETLVLRDTDGVPRWRGSGRS